MTNAIRDENHVTVALGVSSASSTTTLPFKVDSSTGRVLVDMSGGGLEVETPVGAVDGSNVTYTVTNEPLFIVADGMVRVSGQGYTYLAGTVTMDALIAPVQFIRSFYV